MSFGSITICNDKADVPSTPIFGDIAVMATTNDYLVFDGSHWIPMGDQDHPDFREGGKLYDGETILNCFPPEKKETFLNYVKLFHSDRLCQLLCYYSFHILKQPWPEAEEYIFENKDHKQEYINWWS